MTMITHLTDTDTRIIAQELLRLREEGGGAATGRVLTLIVLAHRDDDLDRIITIANEVSREHPARVLVLVAGEPWAESRLDADLHFGGDAGAAEIVVMHSNGEVSEHPEAVVTPLLLPDTPIVAWWPSRAPQVPSATPVGQIAQRRITDAFVDPSADGINVRRSGYTPGDTDLCWSRLTSWRGVLASALDLPPHGPVTDAIVEGPGADPSVDLAAGWLADRLGVTVTRAITDDPKVPLDNDGGPKSPVTRVYLDREDCPIELRVTGSMTAVIAIGSRPPFRVALTRRTTSDCLAEELRHLDPDVAYGRALRALSRVRRTHPEH